ncbi:MAG: nuclear transport factor 2 family protein [Chitinophagales bacterium]|nr:nuclear transport factor 2 family protein [Chitinophagales bacterium]
MKHLLFSFLLTCCAWAGAEAQTEDHALIEIMIKDFYFEGWMTGDTAKVGRAMHPTCHLKYYRDSTFSDISRADYLSKFKPRAKEAGMEGRIISLDVTGNIASAKCELETPKALFTDYFNLIKTREGWFIVDKVSTRVIK